MVMVAELPADDATLPATSEPDAAVRSLLERLDISERLLAGEERDVPLVGDGSPQVRPQARDPQSAALTPDGLKDLVTSIGTVGLLHRIIVEENDGVLWLIVGQRRLAASRLGAQMLPDNPHFTSGTIRALVIPGPLGEWELRAVQLAENIARKDLTQSDLGRALWFARCALLIERVRADGLEPPTDRLEVADPVVRWERLNEWREEQPTLHNVGASWTDTVATLGLELSEERADEIAKFFRDLGPDRSERLDQLGASSRARTQARYAAREGLGGAVDEIVEAVEEMDDVPSHRRSRLLEESVRHLRDNPTVDPQTAVDQARVAAHAGGNGQQRSLPAGSDGDGEEPDVELLGLDGAEGAQVGGSVPARTVDRLVVLIEEATTTVREDITDGLTVALEQEQHLNERERGSLLLALNSLRQQVDAAVEFVRGFPGETGGE